MPDSIEATVRRLNSLPVFFVAGLPRSGTTWLQQMLNAHPKVLCLGESHFMNDVVPDVYKVLWDYTKKREKGSRTWAPGVVGPKPAHMGPVFQMAFAALAAANLGDKDPDDLVVIGEKNPDNLFHAQRVWRVYPKARMVHIIRDPRDGAVSGFARFRPRLPDDLTRPEYVEAYSHDWVARIEAARSAAKGRAYMEIRYEDLHADTFRHALEIFRFIGAPEDPEMVRAAMEAASFERLSGGRKRGERDATSHYRRGEVGGWRDEMTPEEIAIAERNAGALMTAIGYELSGGGSAAARATP